MPARTMVGIVETRREHVSFSSEFIETASRGTTSMSPTEDGPLTSTDGLREVLKVDTTSFESIDYDSIFKTIKSVSSNE